MALAQDILRPGLLDGVAVVLAGGASGPGARAAAACRALGADVAELAADPLDEAAVAAAAGALARADVLVADAASAFAAARGGLAGVRAGADGAWNATRAVVNARMRPAGGGLVVLLAPRPGAGEHAGALRAALENVARTCSVEWARYGVRPVAVLAGDATGEDDLAALVAWLASPAGAYFSGCAFTLR